MNGVSVTRMATARNDFTLDVPLGGDYRARLGIKRSCIWTSFRITGHFFRKPFGTIPRVKKLDVFGRIRQAATDGDPFAQFEVGLDYDWGTNALKRQRSSISKLPSKATDPRQTTFYCSRFSAKRESTNPRWFLIN